MAMQTTDDIVTAIAAMASALSEIDVTSLATSEVARQIVLLERVRAVLDATQNRLVDQFDQSAGSTVYGHRTTRSWLRQHCQMSGANVTACSICAMALVFLPARR